MAGGKLTNKALKHVSGLKELRYIDFPQSLRDEDLQHLQDLVKLRNLRLGNVTDEGMSWVARLHSVRSLDFSRSKITDKNSRHSLEFREIERVELERNQHNRSWFDARRKTHEAANDQLIQH